MNVTNSSLYLDENLIKYIVNFIYIRTIKIRPYQVYCTNIQPREGEQVLELQQFCCLLGEKDVLSLADI